MFNEATFQEILPALSGFSIVLFLTTKHAHFQNNAALFADNLTFLN